MNAADKLKKKNNSKLHICVGLDPDENKIPSFLKKSNSAILDFNSAIVNETSSYVAAYKLNFAFYECFGSKGLDIISDTIKMIPDDILIIADAKRGDIGNSSKKYASSIFEYFKCDAVTLNPYMGEDSISPFREYKDKLNFILALTSNPGANDFEKLKLENGNFLFQEVISKVKQWNGNNNCGIVFGATKLDELLKNIMNFDTLPVLLPGIGAQGGDLNSVVKTFLKNNKKNFLINTSRSVIYKSSGINFAKEAKDEVVRMNEIISSLYSN